MEAIVSNVPFFMSEFDESLFVYLHLEEKKLVLKLVHTVPNVKISASVCV